MGTRKALGVAVLALLTTDCSLEPRSCTEMACSDQKTTLRATVAVPLAQLSGGKVIACRSSGCVTSYSVVSAPNGSLAINFAAEPSPGALVGSIVPVQGGSRAEVPMAITTDRFSVPEQETYRLQIFDGQGASVFDKQAVSAGRSYPNGRECDKDYFCTGNDVTF
ncbi:MAG: hypothetical protein HY898_31325 [Deltaproteobacteria bacterium]|nr:hypothetical protein [Deltaproteobacteria bacterium]